MAIVHSRITFSMALEVEGDSRTTIPISSTLASGKHQAGVPASLGPCTSVLDLLKPNNPLLLECMVTAGELG
jgi:hypothetical protein